MTTRKEHSPTFDLDQVAQIMGHMAHAAAVEKFTAVAEEEIGKNTDWDKKYRAYLRPIACAMAEETLRAQCGLYQEPNCAHPSSHDLIEKLQLRIESTELADIRPALLEAVGSYTNAVRSHIPEGLYPQSVTIALSDAHGRNTMDAYRKVHSSQADAVLADRNAGTHSGKGRRR